MEAPVVEVNTQKQPTALDCEGHQIFPGDRLEEVTLCGFSFTVKGVNSDGTVAAMGGTTENQKAALGSIDPSRYKVDRPSDCEGRPITIGSEVRKVGDSHTVREVDVVRGMLIGFKGCCGMYHAEDFKLVE